jgi:hypothetical protein
MKLTPKMLGDAYAFGLDSLGPHVKECVRGRQIVCRDPECCTLRMCKKFPPELTLAAAQQRDDGE